MQGIIRETNWHVCDISLSRIYAKAISDWKFPITAHNGSLIRLQNRYRERLIKLSRFFLSLSLSSGYWHFQNEQIRETSNFLTLNDSYD